MKRSTSKLMQSLLQRSVFGSVAAASAFATFGLISADAVAGISSTKHNLTSGSTSATTLGKSDSGTEICAFCHTPHAANATVTGAPLWNKKLPTGPFTVYARATIDSNNGTAGSPGANSLICLSCHDGTQAMDSMINAPGSGRYTSAGGFGNYYTTDGKMDPSSVAMLGTDLSNDHPIGLPYCGGGATYAAGVVDTAGCVDKGFNTATSVKINTTLAGSTDQYVVLFPNAAGDNVTVECSSCHDPHVESKDGTNQTQFLRVSQASSSLCLTCHNK